MVTQTNLNKQNEPSPADLCQIPWKGFTHSKRIDPLYVVIQQLSEWGFFADQCAVILVGRWGLAEVKGTVVSLCLLPLDGPNPPEHWGVADAARWGTFPPPRHPRINPRVQSRGYLLRVKSGDDDTRHTHTHTHTHTQFPLYSVWTPRSTSITVSSEPWCRWYLWLICRGSNAEL